MNASKASLDLVLFYNIDLIAKIDAYTLVFALSELAVHNVIDGKWRFMHTDIHTERIIKFRLSHILHCINSIQRP